MKTLDLCAGIGGITLAGEWAGMTPVAFCEIEPYAQKVLQKHWPHVPIISDIHDVTKEALEQHGVGAIDLVSAGYPCQPFSTAGKRRGKEDDRYIWPEVRRVIQEIRPRWFVGENVPGHITMGLDDVLSDLEAEGYEVQTFVIPACAVNASHQRYRVFIVGYAEHDGQLAVTQLRGHEKAGDERRAEESPTSGESPGTDRPGNESCVCRGAIGSEQRPTRTVAGENERETMGNTKRIGCDGESWRRANPEPADGHTQPENGVMANCAGEGLPEWRECGEYPESTETGAGANDRSKRCSKNVADSECRRQQRQGQSIQPGDTTPDGKRQTNQSVDDGIGSIGAAQPGVGRSTTGISDWLDGGGVNPLDALAELIASYPQPALMGQPQRDWEPPRVASGVKDRSARIKTLGNAVNPLQIYPIMQGIAWIDSWIKEGETCTTS